MKKLIFICNVFSLLIFVINYVNSQTPLEYTCGNYLFPPSQYPANPVNGYFKPERTDTVNGNPLISTAFFPVLIVFVQFLDDTSDDIWPNTCDTSGPIYRDSLISFTKNNTQSWWHAYDQFSETFSNYYIQLSRGKFHVLGKAYSVRLDHNASFYRDSGTTTLNEHIWNKLNDKYDIDWSRYDKWSWDNSNFEYTPDNNIDFIYKIHKSTGGVLPEYDGYSSLDGSDFKVDSLRWIRSGYGYTSSGITCARNIYKNNVVGICVHEQGHYTFSGGHLIYGHNMYAIGFDAFYSPYEMTLSGYMYPRNADFGQSNFLGDYSSRNNGGGEVIKVPISETEFFLLANRRKVCYWDRVMLGDTALYDPYISNNYGKGLYIYHVFNGIYRPQTSYSSPQDMECADGYYRWEITGWASVDLNCWTSGAVWKTYKKAEVLYENDPSLHGTHLLNTLKGDDLSLHDFSSYNNDGSPRGYSIHHNRGSLPEDNCHLGMNRLFTNDTNLYTSFDNMGDRWDCWNPGYNEVFSTYSSPSTLKHNNDTSGIFIWFSDSYGDTAEIKIYKATEYGGDITLSEILEATPPSRPMGLKIDRTECENYRRYPILTWNHNMEPDMLQGYPSANYKRYKIYRAWNEVDYVPVNYTEIDDILIHKDSIPRYIDTDTYGQCDQGSATINYRLRYKVKAVDNTDWASVYSDFVSISSYYLNRGGDDGDKFTLGDENLPKKFDLSQNYPNPFNPVTRINFAIPKQGFVTLKIYDITGREVKVLVNEFKQAGYYTVDLNGSNFASGVYFFRIQSGSFISVKKMVLIK